MRDKGDLRDYLMLERVRNCLRRIGAEEVMDRDKITFENVDEGHASPDDHGQPSKPTGYGLHDDDTCHDTPMEPPSTIGSSYHAHEVPEHQLRADFNWADFNWADLFGNDHFSGATGIAEPSSQY
ncbi:unnamed protein product [Cuscuta europaea]|uniref:Uncharacterized protein n=1 Tax=Cuscuta europaea TaxID=41803 RepID=A0A9P0YWW3_CUSEU|nr:unnamed protein product [Cuscuta europaea]